MKKLLILLLFSLGFTGISSAGEVETNILKFKSLNACEKCNLSGANLSYKKSGNSCLKMEIPNNAWVSGSN